MNVKTLVIKDNRMIEASYTLDLVEQRIVLMSLAWARQNDVTLTHETFVELRADEYVTLYGVDLVTAYRQLKSACESLQARKIKIWGIDRATGAPALYTSNWVNTAIYVDKVGLVRLRFDDILVPYVSNLESHFTSYQLGAVCGLSSGYAIRLYELLSQYKKIGARKIAIGDLRAFLDCTGIAYDRIDNFKRRVIDPCIDQINRLTDLECSYQVDKMGARVVGFIFKMKLKTRPAKRQIKPKALPAPVSLPISLTTAERAMLKDLQALQPDITLETIQEMSLAQGLDPLMVMINLKKTI